ncbi:serine-aspartate repeat-containing protein F isoform X2 [Drosophila kikkawai]|uniref:Serine-aspartate repeat-containing protein F isoform X2 n=1 Tax=Drosophila kikkawai TaxID=30033 RepID=A0A6P4JF37_DROKI|nr:WASH complex subunit 2 isoform X2 [Drosophila kikkawai]
MAQETGTTTGTGTGAKDQRQRDHIDEDEVSELQKSRSFYDRVREQAERFASTRMGQFVIERADRALVMIEDTAKWSLPQEKSAVPLARPLPWGPFLMLIILLRLTRIWLSVGALMIGNGPISPSDMVYFIQTRRRKLRAIRVHGLKVMRQQQQEVSYGSSSASGRGLTHKLTQWLSKAMCRPGVQRANSGRLFTVRNTEQTTQTTPAVMKRPREEDSHADADHNLTIDQMLAKYANENSEDDSDFVPNAEEEDTSGSSSESSQESSDEISSGEAEEVLSQAKPKPVENGVHKAAEKENDKEQDKDKAKGKAHLTTSSSNGDKDAVQEPAAEVGGATTLKVKLEDPQKSSPGHISAAMMNTRTYNNTAAAASTDPQTEPQPEPESEPHPQTETESFPETPTELPQQTPTENEESEDDEDSCSTSGSSQTGSTVESPENHLQLQSHSQAQPDTQAEQIREAVQQLSNYPTVDTLTPATSSEDIFYSPIGSPTCFNTSLGTQALLKNASLKSVLGNPLHAHIGTERPTH